MATHVVHSSAAFATKATGKDPIRSMHSAEVLRQIPSLKKGTATHLTGKTLLRDVTTLVCAALRLGIEALVADVTDKSQAAGF